MTNFECVVAVLARHRLARRWTDEAVAHEVCAELALAEADTAANATPGVDVTAITEAEVLEAEAEANKAIDKATAARARFDDRAGLGDRDTQAQAALADTLQRAGAEPQPVVTQETAGDRLRREADEADRAEDPELAAMKRADAGEADLGDASARL